MILNYILYDTCNPSSTFKTTVYSIKRFAVLVKKDIFAGLVQLPDKIVVRCTLMLYPWLISHLHWLECK